jgi:hypothetical protein
MVSEAKTSFLSLFQGKNKELWHIALPLVESETPRVAPSKNKSLMVSPFSSFDVKAKSHLWAALDGLCEGVAAIFSGSDSGQHQMTILSGLYFGISSFIRAV